MSDASGDTTVQFDSGDLPPATNLLSLPNELLVKIARNIAPDGGRKAESLRLVNRHLGRVLAPVTWASLVLPEPLVERDELCAEFLANPDGSASFVTSILCEKPNIQLKLVVLALKALKSLRRLHLRGQPGSVTPLFFEPLSGLKDVWEGAIELRLEYVDLSGCTDLRDLAPNLKRLTCVGCLDATQLFTDANDAINLIISAVEDLYYAPSARAIVATEFYDALIACHHAVDVVLVGDVLSLGDSPDVMVDTEVVPSRLRSLALKGTRRLFKASDPSDVDTIISILNWAGLGPLNSLVLPVIDGNFHVNPQLANLSLPTLQTLVLDVQRCDPALHPNDYLDFGKPAARLKSTLTQLVKVLKLASLPFLSTLHLRGWIDITGAATVATTPLDGLPAEHPVVYSLLGFLRARKVTELRMENSPGHADGDIQCILSREGDGEWVVRLATFW